MNDKTDNLDINSLKDASVELLKIDFEKAFEVHEDYKKYTIDYWNILTKTTAFPVIIASVFMTAKYFSASPKLVDILDLEIIWYALVISGILNFATLRAYILTDRVHIEAKHQVNCIRSIYLIALKDFLPNNWSPCWGSTNAYMKRKIKLRGSNITSLIFGAINSTYFVYGLYRIILNQNIIDHISPVYIYVFIAISWVIQQQFILEFFYSNVSEISKK